jgi:hypothetical protein
MTDVDAYRTWWPWLTRLEGGAFAAGEQWACAVQPPLPYTLRFELHLDAVEPPHRAEATITGDIAGTARLTVEPDGEGSELRLESSLSPANPVLRGIARVAAPIVRFGHDWVLDTGVGQFRRRGLG